MHLIEVGVLDEIQMISHPERGWAWSRVLLGLPAEHLHVCGSGDALPLIRSLVAACGDELVEHEYERLTPLKVSPSLDGDLSRVRRGDCVVAFSRREIFGLKQKVEAASGLRCRLRGALRVAALCIQRCWVGSARRIADSLWPGETGRAVEGWRTVTIVPAARISKEARGDEGGSAG